MERDGVLKDEWRDLGGKRSGVVTDRCLRKEKVSEKVRGRRQRGENRRLCAVRQLCGLHTFTYLTIFQLFVLLTPQGDISFATLPRLAYLKPGLSTFGLRALDIGVHFVSLIPGFTVDIPRTPAPQILSVSS